MDFKNVEAIHNWNGGIATEFRANEGKVGGPFSGAPLLILTTTGNKTGKQHETPLVYLQDGSRVLVFGSKGGYPEDPAWFKNLVANPTVQVEIGADKYDAKAIVLEGEERDRLFEKQAKLMPNFAEYQAKTDRKIPVIALVRA